jgi:hypothetical protein
MNAVPRVICSVTAWMISGQAWPWIRDAMLLEKSMRVTPSMSVTRQPLPHST